MTTAPTSSERQTENNSKYESRSSCVANLVEVKVPDIGDFKDIPVIEILVKVGDTINKEDSLVSLESDKATMEVPSSVAGVVKEIKVAIGDKVSEGHTVLVVEAANSTNLSPAAAPTAVPALSASPAAPAAPPVQAPAPTHATQSSSVPAHRSTSAVATEIPSSVHASPSIRKLAREYGVDLTKVRGTANKGRITEDDVKGFVKAELAKPKAASSGGAFAFPEMPHVDFSKFGETEKRALSRIKKLSGNNLARNWVMIPHVTQQDDADITDVEAFRVKTNEEIAKSGVKVTMLAFLIKASVAALKKFPEFNASLEPGGENLILKKYYNIGFAADTPNGLVVPVIRNADQKTIIELAKESSELAAKAREGKLSPAEMSGGCFSISSLGGIGGSYFTPIINAPEVAILGVSKSSMKPVWNGKEFVPRLILPMSLSYDHRVVDGASGARFTTYLAGLMSDIRKLVL
ncbi:MAG: dihydrolipoyllysine-residue acetyltransferase [Betaproteobacteria bacterium]|nr:dihydrolipoyllysine-residue acetyltransferase [Betaproteobacteria bacterium]